MEIERAVANVEEDIKDIYKRVNGMSTQVATLMEAYKQMERRILEDSELIKGLHKLTTSVELHALKIDTFMEKMETRLEQLEEQHIKYGERLTALELQPGKTALKTFWTIFAAALTGLGSFFIGWLLNKGGN